MTATWTKQEVENYDRHRMRYYLRRDTPYRNTDEYFHALLMMTGLPPFRPEQRHVSLNIMSGVPAFQRWREKTAIILNETLHCSVDPTFAMREYFKWLEHNWNKHSSER